MHLNVDNNISFTGNNRRFKIFSIFGVYAIKKIQISRQTRFNAYFFYEKFSQSYKQWLLKIFYLIRFCLKLIAKNLNQQI